MQVPFAAPTLASTAVGLHLCNVVEVLAIIYVRQAHESQGTRIDVDSELGKYLAWAELQADRLDPAINSPKTILDEVIPDESSFPSYRRW